MPNWILLTILLKLIEFFSSVNFMYLEVPKPYIADIIGYYTLIVFALYAIYNDIKNKKILYILTLVLLILFLVPRLNDSSIEIVFPHSPDEDITLIKFPSEGRDKIMLITGDSNKFNTVERVIQPLLWANHISKIDYLFLNRVSDDHLGTVVDLSKNFNIKQVLDIAQAKNSFTYKNFLDFIKDTGFTYKNIKHKESVFESSGISLNICGSNLILRIASCNTELLITPDCVHTISINGRKILIYQHKQSSIIEKRFQDKDIYRTKTQGAISIKIKNNKVKILCSKEFN